MQSNFNFVLHHKARVVLALPGLGGPLHQAESLQPGVLTAGLCWAGPGPGTVGEEEGGGQGHQAGTGDNQEQAQPAKPLLDRLQDIISIKKIFLNAFLKTENI